jgi:ribosomal protein S14
MCWNVRFFFPYALVLHFVLEAYKFGWAAYVVFFYPAVRPNLRLQLTLGLDYWTDDSSPVPHPALREAADLLLPGTVAAGSPSHRRSVARVHRPGRPPGQLRRGAARLLLCRCGGRCLAMNGGIPGFRTLSISPSRSSLFLSIRSGCRFFGFPFLRSGVAALILARSDLVLRRQCSGVEGRGRRRRALLRPLRLPRPLPRPRTVLPGKSPLPCPYRLCVVKLVVKIVAGPANILFPD